MIIHFLRRKSTSLSHTQLGSFLVLLQPHFPSSGKGIKKPRTSCLILRFGKTCCHKQESPRNTTAGVSPFLVATLKFPDFSITKKSENAFADYLLWFFFGSNSLYHNDLS